MEDLPQDTRGLEKTRLFGQLGRYGRRALSIVILLCCRKL